MRKMFNMFYPDDYVASTYVIYFDKLYTRGVYVKDENGLDLIPEGSSAFPS